MSCIKCSLFNVKTKLSIYEIDIHLKLCFKDGEMVYFFIEGLILNPVECIYNLVIGGKQSFLTASQLLDGAVAAHAPH